MAVAKQERIPGIGLCSRASIVHRGSDMKRYLSMVLTAVLPGAISLESPFPQGYAR
jgi:hypothetical protein